MAQGDPEYPREAAGQARYPPAVSPSDVGVYVHVPFCERVCPYCDFAVVARRRLDPGEEERYLGALLAELERRAGDFAGRELATIYLGGGTPSLLAPESVARVVAAVRAAFPGAAPREVTLEVNPSRVERARLPAFRDAGVTRVSVGAQSFDDETLKRLGRAHRAAECRRTLEACRAAGFAALSIDLIVAAPRQTLAAVERDLAAAVDHAPEHLSVYELGVEPGTPFARAEARGQLRRPDEEEAVAMLERAEARLAAAGYARYEISSYARPGFEALHNRRYWERRPVLGLGVGAYSTDPPSPAWPFGARRANPRELAAYLERVGRAEPPDAEVLGAATARAEAAFLGLRTARGVDAAGFASEFGAPPRAWWDREIDALLGEGLIAEAPGGDLRLTPRGRLLADSVFLRFV
jgi:putative oxygen-independent coproporphyrinogen III oxidase